MTEPVRIASTTFAGMSRGAGCPGTAAVVITTSMSAMWRSSRRCCSTCWLSERTVA